jgi:hypothetical protein
LVEDDGPVSFTTYTLTASTSQGSSQFVTTQGTVFTGGLADTIVQAGPGEVIYSYPAITSWGGHSAATARAVSATRITLTAAYSLAQIPQVTEQTNGTVTSILGNTSRSWSNSSFVTSFQFTTVSSTFATFTSASITSKIPNSTRTFVIQRSSTRTSSIASTVFASSSSSQAATGGSTREASLLGVIWGGFGTLYDVNVSWQVPQTTATSTTFTAFSPIVLCRQSERSSSQSGATIDGDVGAGLTGNRSQTSSSESGISSGRTILQNTYIHQAPICGTAAGATVGQARHVPRAYKLATESGLYYTWDEPTSITLTNVSYALQARNELSTIFPLVREDFIATSQRTTISGVPTTTQLNTTFSRAVTWNGKSVTYTGTTVSESQTITTTSSAEIKVSGSSFFVNGGLFPITVWGGTPGPQETFVNQVGGDGVFRDRINGGTSFIRRGASTFNSAIPVSRFEPLVNMYPPLGQDQSTRPDGSFYVQARNSLDLPPNLSVDDLDEF